MISQERPNIKYDLQEKTEISRILEKTSNKRSVQIIVSCIVTIMLTCLISLIGHSMIMWLFDKSINIFFFTFSEFDYASIIKCWSLTFYKNNQLDMHGAIFVKIIDFCLLQLAILLKLTKHYSTIQLIFLFLFFCQYEKENMRKAKYF